MARLGTVSLGRIGGIGDCLIADQSEGMCPDGTPYLGTLDNGGAAIDLSTLPNYADEAIAAGIGVPPPQSTSSLPINLLGLVLPKGVTASPTGLQTGAVCPAGTTLIGGVCSPSSPVATTFIPGVPNWVVYGGGALLLLLTVMSGQGGRR